MADKSKLRMNLSSIKKVDPYAKDIIDSSSHVAFYTFSAEKNEWEKTDIEGAFFIYNRSGHPYYSIFINNRINTNSFVEPITSHLEIQLQSPFLLYRNERSRIRGFWFYNGDECNRVAHLIKELAGNNNSQKSIDHSTNNNDISLYNTLKGSNLEVENLTRDSNVLKFFANAKPSKCDKLYNQQILDKKFSLEQIEKQQRNVSPENNHNINNLKQPIPAFNCNVKIDQENPLSLMTTDKITMLSTSLPPISSIEEFVSKPETLTSPNTNGLHKYTFPSSSKEQFINAFEYLIKNDDIFSDKLHQTYLRYLK